MDQFNNHLLIFLNEYGATVMGFVLAFLMALWRTAKVNGKADWLEASMCAGFTLGVASFLAYLGLPKTLSIDIGAVDNQVCAMSYYVTSPQTGTLSMYCRIHS